MITLNLMGFYWSTLYHTGHPINLIFTQKNAAHKIKSYNSSIHSGIHAQSFSTHSSLGIRLAWCFSFYEYDRFSWTHFYFYLKKKINNLIIGEMEFKQVHLTRKNKQSLL